MCLNACNLEVMTLSIEKILGKRYETNVLLIIKYFVLSQNRFCDINHKIDFVISKMDFLISKKRFSDITKSNL